MAEKTIDKFLARVVRLHEQEEGEPFSSPPTWVIPVAVGDMGKKCGR